MLPNSNTKPEFIKVYKENAINKPILVRIDSISSCQVIESYSSGSRWQVKIGCDNSEPISIYFGDDNKAALNFVAKIESYLIVEVYEIPIYESKLKSKHTQARKYKMMEMI